MKFLFTPLLLCIALAAYSQTTISISKEQLKDKIAGGWAGKMIGVTYGAPEEFRAQGKTFDDPINWAPKDIIGSLWQDDIYVQLTFMMTMDKYGIDAPAKKFQEMFAKAGYELWHANVQARKNYYDSIFPPQSGNPKYNPHADDIDFQIEADYLGFMCPGMPNTAAHMANKIGHIMNYGDGVYGGIFLAALHTQAFFDNNIPAVINKAIQSLPAKSDYATMIRDVMRLHQQYPGNWKAAWKELQDKWGDDHFCGAGETFDIDAKLNGAYIVMGLLYGEGDPMKTLEITTRCGQDADCNPSSAMAVLGLIIGFDKLPAAMKQGVKDTGDSLFINTTYSFNKAVENTYHYALQLVQKNGGRVGDNMLTILLQKPKPAPLEVSFDNTVLKNKISVFNDQYWKLTGNWQIRQNGTRDNKPFNQSKYAAEKDAAIELEFTGSGIAVDGNWCKDGGKADVYVDGKFNRTIDSYFFYNNQEHENITLWHITNLTEGKHQLKLVLKGEKRMESSNTRLYVTDAVIFNKAAKKSKGFKFLFEK